MVKDNKKTILGTQNIKTNSPIQLKFMMNPDLTWEVFYEQDNTGWKQIGLKQEIRFLPHGIEVLELIYNSKDLPTSKQSFQVLK